MKTKKKSSKSRTAFSTDADLEDLESRLAVDENSLEIALRDHTDAFYQVSKALTLWRSRRDALKQYVGEVEASVDMALRREAVKNNEKITEREVEARKMLDSRVKSARNDFLQVSHKVSQFSDLRDAFLQRSYALKELVALYVYNYYGDSPHDPGNMKEAHAGRVKRDMASRRKARE